MKNEINTNITDFAGDEPIVGISPAAKKLSRVVEKLSKTNHNVLLIGETGSGRKFITQKIFNQSRDYNKKLVSIDCATLGKTIQFNDLYGETSEDKKESLVSVGLLEKANNGILLLENVDMMNFEFQDEFLRILRDYTIRKIGDNKNIALNIRVISTTENDILDKVETGKFRRELYLLLNTLVVAIPPLRERKQDIPSLFSYFHDKFSKENKVEKAALSEEIFDSLIEYNWKGNIGELKESTKKLVTMSPKGELSAEFLPFRVKKHPFDFLEPQRFRSIIPEVQAFLIRKALRKTNGNQVKAAKLLGLPEPTLRFKIIKFHVQRK
jgi:two-component system, NtrC family, response regulator AtoC